LFFGVLLIPVWNSVVFGSILIGLSFVIVVALGYYLITKGRAHKRAVDQVIEKQNSKYSSKGVTWSYMTTTTGTGKGQLTHAHIQVTLEQQTSAVGGHSPMVVNYNTGQLTYLPINPAYNVPVSPSSEKARLINP